MKSSIAAGLAVLAMIGTDQFAFADGGAVRVRISGFRNGEGDLACALFASAASFLGVEPFAKVKVPAGPSGTECVFRGIPAGRYAVSVLHDENRNGKMDRVPLIGLPREGYGVSNNKTYSTHPPVFEESAFEFDGKADLVLDIRLRY